VTIPVALTDRVDFLNARIQQLETELRNGESRLAAAPRWYRPAVLNPRLPPGDRAVFTELERVRISVNDLRADLRKLRDLVQGAAMDPARWKRCTLRALEWINTAATWRDLARDFTIDPAVDTRPRPPRVSTGPRPIVDDPRRLQETFQAILDFRNAQPGRKLRRLEDLIDRRIVKEDLFHSLVYTGCTLLPPIVVPAPTPVVPVLLPVRLETRFDPPVAAGQSWHLRLRIVPDEAIIDRFDPLASDDELNLVERLWQETAGQLDGQPGQRLWEAFLTRLGGARAAWLIREFPMVIGTNGQPTITRPIRRRTEPLFPTTRGIPARIEIWLGRGGAAPQRVTTLVVDRLAAARLDLPDLSAGERRWWTSYAEAERIGLATNLDLGARADDIDVLLVVGLSGESSADWYTHHCDYGHVGLLAPGVPTNSVEGEAAAPVDGDAAHWLRVGRRQGANDPGARAVAVTLTGDGANARPLLGGATDVNFIDRILVQGLWYPLWGYPFKDLFGLGAATHLAGTWAVEALRPEGPLPTLRIGAQPYGLLPVTALDRWQAGANDPPFENAALNCLRSARDAWAAVAQNAGTVVGADTDKLLDLLGRVPTSTAYASRWFIPLEVLYLLWLMADENPSWAALAAAYDGWIAGTRNVCGNIAPQLPMVAGGWPVDLPIPLVQPDNLTEQEFRDLVKRLAQPNFNVVAIFKEGGWRLLTRGGVVPNSLLIRLLVFAHWVAAAEVWRERQNNPAPAAPDIFWNPATGDRLLRDATGAVFNAGGPALALREHLQAACAALAAMPIDEIERAMCAVLDTASHRLDPWLTGYAIRRLDDEGAGWTRQLGIYGWVDAPRPGQPGPTAGGLLHAPSQAQAYTAMVLRDRAISHPEAPKWTMNVDSASARTSDRLGAGVRAGGHITEVLGAEVERVVGVPAQIDALRANFPIRVEHGGRRVCDGVAVLAANLAPFNLPVATLNRLAELRRALDTYGDLLVAEAVHRVVSGRGETAGAAMDAAAGLAQPPTLEVLHTSRSGRTVATTAVFCLPDVAAPAITLDTSPTLVADPAFATFVQSVTGAANAATWTWLVDPPAGAPITIALADIGLSPWDAAVLPKQTIERLVIAHAPMGATIRLTSTGLLTHRRARGLIGMGGGEPGEPKHLVSGSKPSGQAVADDLRTRLAALELHATQMRNAIQTAVNDTPAAQALALLRATRWGVTAIEQAEQTVAQQLTGAAAALTDRLGTLPAVGDRAALSSPDVARLIAELAVGDGRWPILGRVDLAPLGLSLTRDARPAGAFVNPFDQVWLAIVAPVRDVLSRMEAAQFDEIAASGSPLLDVWTNRPGDPWQQAGTRDPDTGRLPASRLLVGYGPAAALDGIAPGTGVRAIGLLDSWSEVVPEVDHTTTAGFGFNAPASRAPQALLIGVPPSPDGVLADGDLAAIVFEARRLARVRVAQSSELGQVSAAAPAMVWPAALPAGVDLRRSP
jgi:hypothetical protein